MRDAKAPATSEQAEAPDHEPTAQEVERLLASPATEQEEARLAVLVEEGRAGYSRSAFVARMRAVVTDAANRELASVGRTANDCPYIRFWLDHYSRVPPEHLERAIRRYARPRNDAPAEYLRAIAERSVEAVQHWKETGVARLPGLPVPASRLIDLTSSPQQLIDALGPGVQLPAPLRSQAERVFARPVSDVQLHTTGEAAALPARLGARALAVGRHVVIGTGHYRPGTPVGDAILGHELAHALQQPTRGPAQAPSAALEREADVAGLHFAAHDRLHTRAPPPLSRSRGLSLQRCSRGVETSEGEASAPPSDQELADSLDEAAKVNAPAPTAPTAASPAELTDLSDFEYGLPAVDERVLFLWSKERLYALPAKGLVFEAKPPPAPKSAPGGGPVAGLPTSGHSGVYMVRTSQGAGLLVDAGGTTGGNPQVLMPISLASLATRLNIKEITGTLLSHTHADHVANLPMLVRTRSIKGPNVWVYPGWEKATKGPLGKVWAELQKNEQALKDAGYGPGWKPNALTVTEVKDSQGGDGYVEAELSVGNARFKAVTLTKALKAYNKALAEGKSGTALADSASMLTRVTAADAKFDMLIVGDLRGADLLRIRDKMGEAAFNALLANTRVLGGIQHHLGAVNSKADVDGIRLLLRALRPAEQPLTVTVQTGAGRNLDLVQALVQAGVKVVALGELDPAKSVTITASGEVRAKGASVYEPSKDVVDARARIAELRRAAELIEQTPELTITAGKSRSEIVQGLRDEAARLTRLTDERVDLATSPLHSSTRDAALETKLKANTEALARSEGMAAELGQETVGRLSRYRTHAEEIARELKASRMKGEASKRLRELIAAVEPSRAQEILEEELANAASQSKRNLRRARNRAIGRMKQAAGLMEMRSPPQLGAVGKGTAVVLLAIEVVNLAAPFIEMYQQNKAAKAQGDFGKFFGIAGWWEDRGATPPLRGRANGAEVSDPKQFVLSAHKRVWKDLPDGQKKKLDDLPEDLKAASEMTHLWVPKLADWKADEAVSFWDRFRLWVTVNVRNYDDYAAEFEDVPGAPIRISPTTKGEYFEDLTWEILTGRLDGDHVSFDWEPSAMLTRIMQATAGRVIAGTRTMLEQRGKALTAAPPATSPVPTIGPAIGPAIGFTPSTDAEGPHPESVVGKIVRRAHFKKGASRKAYSGYKMTETTVGWIPDDPQFFVHSGGSERAGYSLVSGADYNTFASLRQATVWTYDPAEVVQIQKDTTKPYEALPSEPERTPEEKQALEGLKHGLGTYRPRSGTVYRGEVLYPFSSPNVSGQLFVKDDDLETVK